MLPSGQPLRAAAVLIALAAASACNPSPLEVAREFTHAHNRQDTDAVKGLFTADARIRLADGRILQGRAGVSEFMEWSLKTRRRFAVITFRERDDPTIPVFENSQFLWLLRTSGIRYPAAPRFKLDGRRIAELDLTEPWDGLWKPFQDRLRDFEHWARAERPDAFEQLRDEEGWLFDASLADLWMETLEAWRQYPTGSFRITARPVQAGFPFGEFPRFEVTVHNLAAAPLHLSMKPGGRPSSWISFRFLDSTGADRGLSTHVDLAEESIHVPQAESRSFVYPERERRYYKQSDQAMLPGTYDYLIVMGGVADGIRVGSSTSNGGSFDVTDDGSVELSRLRATDDLNQLRAGLALMVERREGRSFQLHAANRGWSEISFRGSYWMWHFDGPEGPSSKQDGPRGSDVETLVPGQRSFLQSVTMSRREPGWHRIWAVYYTPDLEPLCKSNTIHYLVR